MITQQLIDYIKTQLKLGVKEKEIIKTLLENGWGEDDVQAGLSAVKSKMGETSQPETFGNTPYNRPNDFPSTHQTNQPLNQLIRNKKILIISLVGVVIIIAGIALATQKFFRHSQTKTTTTATTPKPLTVEKNQVSLSIKMSKDTYKIGDEIKLQYFISNKGKPFSALVIDKLKGPLIAGTARGVTPIDTKTGTDQPIGGDSISQAYAGEYVFSVSVYKCKDIELLDKECSSDISDRKTSCRERV